MIDVHTHILAGLDDGAEKMEQTKQMLELAMEERITDIITTPHAFHPIFKTSIKASKKQLDFTNNYIEEHELPIRLYSGQECRLSEKLPELLEAGEALTLAGSKYVLLELPTIGVPAYTIPLIQKLIVKGYIPIIAHPERNQGIIEKPERLQKLVIHGAFAQVTAGSVAGYFGKVIQRTALSLVYANLIHVYGSDVHSIDKRPFLFNKGLDYLEKKKLSDMVDVLLENNERILYNKNLIVLEPQDISKSKWWNFFV